ncbi:MAG TPA: hypothetical protein VE995_01515 [Gaiellaceae bacterium]|nr:hypothetical protein [Gaiellaceae bacterium]
MLTVRLLPRALRAARIAATDQRIPRPLRLALVLGALPIPGPLDEALLLLAAVPLLVCYRGPLADAWRRAQDARTAPARARSSPARQPASLRGRLTIALGLLAALAWSCLLFGIGLDDLTDGDTKPGVIFSVTVLSLLVVSAASALWSLVGPYAKRLVRG